MNKPFKPFKDWTKKQWFQFTVLVVVFLISATVVVFFSSYVIKLSRDEGYRKIFEDTMSSLGIFGALLLVIIEIVQIVLAFIPGGPIQIVAGSLYGSVIGILICVGGTIVANLIIFFLVRRFGKKVTELFISDDDQKKYRFLSDAKRVERTAVLLFFIPGTPKDALTYIFAGSKISLKRFTFLTVVARLPGMMTSVIAGDFIANGQWGKAVLTFCVLGAIGGLGLFLKGKFAPHKGEK